MNQDETYSDEDYQVALDAFSKRLIVTEIPEETQNQFKRYTKQIQGISCTLVIINEDNTVSPLYDDLELPLDELELWNMAIKNSIQLSQIDEDFSDKEKNVYTIKTISGRAIVCCDAFWDAICDTYGIMRLIVTLYYKPENGTIVMASTIQNEDSTSIKKFLHEANHSQDKPEPYRKSYVYVKNIGILSEMALNSEY